MLAGHEGTQITHSAAGHDLVNQPGAAAWSA
jgi:hypothetical protein